MCITKECPDPTVVGLWWRDDDQWRLYDAASTQAILQALLEGLATVNLKGLASAVHPRGAAYIVDLHSMQQRNAGSGHRRAVKLVLPSSVRANYTFVYVATKNALVLTIIEEARREDRVLEKVKALASPNCRIKEHQLIKEQSLPYLRLQSALKKLLSQSVNLLEDVKNAIAATSSHAESQLSSPLEYAFERVESMEAARCKFSPLTCKSVISSRLDLGSSVGGNGDRPHVVYIRINKNRALANSDEDLAPLPVMSVTIALTL